MTDVYISYVREDRKRVRPLVRFLRNEGLDVWWDENPPADGKWTPTVRRALVESAAIIVFWSEQSAASSWIAAEANHAHDRRALVPVMLEDCKPPAPFDKIISADLIKWKGQTDDEEFEDVVRKVKELVEAWKATSATPPPAPEPVIARPPQQQAQPQQQPRQAAAQAAPAGGGFFSASLGGPAQQPTTARATPNPQRPFEPAPQPAQPQAFNPPPQRPTQPPPRAVTPVNEAPRPPQPPRAFTPVNETPRPPQAPPPRLVTPIDEAPRATPAPAEPLPRAVRREPPPPRDIVHPVDEAPRRSGGGLATVLAGAIVAGGLVAAGVIWGLPLLNQGGEVQQAVDVAPLPVPDETASLAEDELNGTIPEDAPIEEAPLAPPEATAPAPAAAPPQTRPPTQPQQAQTRPPAQPRTQQTAALSPPPTQLNLSGVGAVEAPTQAASDTTGDLERCLGRLVRLCPGLTGGRAGFSTDGAISGAERTLLNQRSLFGWSDVTPGNVANCQRHLNAASGRAGAYDPLVSACRAFPVTNAAGPDR